DAHVAHLGAQLAQGAHGLLESALNLLIHALEEVIPRHANGEPARPAPEWPQVVAHRYRARGRIAGIVAGHALEQEGAVLNRARHRPRVVERPREGHDASAARPTIGRLDPRDATESRRPADRPARVGAGGAGDEPRGQRGPGAAARAAGNVVEVPRVAR